MIINLNIRNLENCPQPEIDKFVEIFEALVSTGSLTGVKGGQTIINFDAEGVFQNIQLNYRPWVRRARSLTSPN